MGNIKELHIKVNQGLQRIDSHREYDFLPEEIDMALYKNTLRFVKEKYVPISNRHAEGFEGSRKRIQDLRYLTAYRVGLDVFKASEIDDMSFLNLPIDFLYFESVLFDVKYNQNLMNINKDVEEIVDRFFVIPFPSRGYSTLGEFNVESIPSESMPDVSNTFRQEVSPIVVPTDNEIFITKLLDFYNNNTDFKVFWQSYGEHFYFESFIVKPPTGLNINNVTFNYGNGVSKSDTINTSMLHKYNIEESSNIKETTGVGKFNRYQDDGHLSLDSFYKSTYSNPLIAIDKDLLYIYEQNHFNISKAYISYVRKPRPYSFNMDIGSPFSADIDQEIVDMTVLDLLEQSGSERFQTNIVQEQRKE